MSLIEIGQPKDEVSVKPYFRLSALDNFTDPIERDIKHESLVNNVWKFCIRGQDAGRKRMINYSYVGYLN